MSGQYLTHAHNHITRAVATMDSCFGLVRPHQHGIAVGQKIGLQALCSLPFGQTLGWCSSVPLAFIVVFLN